jgi:hypothetical protein
MKKAEKLRASERIEILTGRVANLRAGAGDYGSKWHREQATELAETALVMAKAELLRH